MSMPHADFVHLRVHSAYSLSEGAIRVKDLVGLCVEHEMPAVAVTDTNNVFGALELSLSARGKGLQPIIGAQISLSREAEQTQRGLITPEPDQLVLLAQSEAGYESLMEILSRAFMNSGGGDDAQVPITDFEELNEGVICLTGGVRGPIGRLLSEGQTPAAEEMTKHLKKIYGDRLYMEIQRHGLISEDRIEDEFVRLAYENEIPLVATNECFFPKKEMYEAHDALICIAEGSYVVETDRRRLTEEHYFKSAEEMKELFCDMPEAIQNTLVIAKRCHYMPDRRAPLLPDYTKLNGRTSAEALRDLAVKGLKNRLEEHVFTADMDEAKRKELATPYEERLQFELGIIEQMGFPGYFLIVADFIQWAKDHDIPVGPGRGSGAGSLVAYALTVTDLDPLKFSLLFERFLNPERVSMPDFDIDFCQDRRDEVITYVQREYGRDRVAQIITFGKLQARAVLRDVGRVLQMPYGQVDRICKLVPNNPANPVTLKEAIDQEPLLQQERDSEPAVARLIEIAMQLEGLFRHASTHAAGVVIGDRPLHELVALYRDPRSDMPVTQFNMKFVEQAGLVKFDFLGLKTLTVISTAEKLINMRDDRQDNPLEMSKIPQDDKVTYDMLCRADATGVFQLESSGMRSVLRDLKPDRLEDLIAVVALYRPGPMENIPTYIKRKHGEEEPVYPHPKLEPVLKETFGIPIYQEQVMQMAQVLAGYTLGGADLLRRAMGKKIKEEMDQQRAIFIKGSKESSGVEAEQADSIFDMINAFAGYGFNKSHAAAYAYVAYQTAWLKANYPVEFLAASMTLDMHNTDKLAVFKGEIERQKIGLLPPDVNKSKVEFSVEFDDDGKRVVRYAMAALKNVGEGAVEAIVSERDANGPFKDIYDFVERVDSASINKRLLENLVKAGAFDSLTTNRRQIYDSIDMLAKYGASTQEEKNSNQVSLFGGGIVETSKPGLARVPDWNQQEKLSNEHAAIGFYLSDHPLNAYKDLSRKLGVVPWTDVAAGRIRLSKGVKLAGLVGAKRIMTTSRGSKMAFIGMSDASGSYEVTLFQEVLNASRELLESGMPLLMTVEVQKRGEGEDAELRLTAQSVSSLEDAAANAARGMRVFIMDESPLQPLSNFISEHGRPGQGRIELVLQHKIPDQEIEMEMQDTFIIDGKFRQAVKAIPGIIDVQDL